MIEGISSQDLFADTISLQSLYEILPPGVQRVRELSAIFTDPRLHELFRNNEILLSVEKTQEGYLIKTENFSLPVKVSYLPNSKGFAGPAKFKLDFEEPIPREDYRILPYPPTLGSLSPSEQRIKEILAILSDPHLFQYISSAEMITKIEKREGGYTIHTHDHVINVDVIYGKDRKILPIDFDLVFK